ncbi:hypothetical protein [Metabacillus fastidiosus]|uniref:hypothetical protein n=1 Tax=Metabacillus fastidiosus TaxID=1458 RepID=UPI002E22BBCD|nr:hypothetical protein [Metabacillus fastidiosus]
MEQGSSFLIVPVLEHPNIKIRQSLSVSSENDCLLNISLHAYAEFIFLKLV